MSKLAAHSAKTIASVASLGGFEQPSLIFERYLTLTDNLYDWHIACERFDRDFGDLTLTMAALSSNFRSGQNPLTAEQRDFIVRSQDLHRAVRFDIKCFYVFAKIPFISYFAVLYAMAGESSPGWQETTKVLKRLRKSDAPELFKAFNAQFEKDLRWFEGNINIYRNKFVEHPHSAVRPGAMVITRTGARIVGISGLDFLEEHGTLIADIVANTGDLFADLLTLPQFIAYYELARRLGDVPHEYRSSVEKMIIRFGLESGDLEMLAVRLEDIFTKFISFLSDWRKKTS